MFCKLIGWRDGSGLASRVEGNSRERVASRGRAGRRAQWGGRPIAARLDIEPLESRTLLAVTAVIETVAVGFVRLNITSDGGDAIAVHCDSGFVKVNNTDPQPAATACNSFNQIQVAGGPGDNVIDMSAVGAADFPLVAVSFRGVVVDGGAGNDRITGAAVRNLLNGRAGNDTVIGGGNTDDLSGGEGDDSIDGGGGSFDTLQEIADVDFTLTDIALIGLGNDVISNVSRVFLTGGQGNNTIDAAATTRPVLLHGGPGNDVLTGGSADDVFSGNEGNDTVHGGPGVDLLHGDQGNDILFGDEDNDTIEDSLGTNTLNGGTGSDRVDFGGATKKVTVNLGLGTAVIKGSSASTLINIENVDGSAFSDTLIGDDADNSLRGFGGNDKIYGRGGEDGLQGGDGNDKLFGDTDNDTLFGEAGNDKLFGGFDDDSITGGAGVDRLKGDDGTDTLVTDILDTLKDGEIVA